MDDLSEEQKQLDQALVEGLELAKGLVDSKSKTAQSAIILGTAAGALYWTLSGVPGYEQDAKLWLDAFFATFTGGLRQKGIELSVTWTRKMKE